MFRVERFRIGLKVLGFGGGFSVWGFEIWLRVWGVGTAKGLGFSVCEFDSEFCVWVF